MNKHDEAARSAAINQSVSDYKLKHGELSLKDHQLLVAGLCIGYEAGLAYARRGGDGKMVTVESSASNTESDLTKSNN